MRKRATSYTDFYKNNQSTPSARYPQNDDDEEETILPQSNKIQKPTYGQRRLLNAQMSDRSKSKETPMMDDVRKRALKTRLQNLRKGQ